jgi:hypothetical protein
MKNTMSNTAIAEHAEQLTSLDPEFNAMLIDSTFTAENAERVLLDLLSSKIKFHMHEEFRIREVSNGDTSHSQKRIAELQQTKREVKEYLTQAKKEGYSLEVIGEVRIKAIKK